MEANILASSEARKLSLVSNDNKKFLITSGDFMLNSSHMDDSEQSPRARLYLIVYVINSFISQFNFISHNKLIMGHFRLYFGHI